MPQIATARVEERQCALTLLPEPNAQSDALRRVATKLMASNDQHLRAVADEMMAQCGTLPHVCDAAATE